MSTLVPSSKPKLPSYLSFPVGSEAISAFIKDAPQFGSLELIFSSDPLSSAMRFRHLVEADEPHLVLQAEFERWEKMPSIGGVEYQDYPRPPSWYFGRKRCEVVFIPKDGTLHIEERIQAS